MKTLKHFISRLRIGYHGHIISRCQRKLDRLYENGESLSSKKMLAVEVRLTKHALVIQRLDPRYGWR